MIEALLRAVAASPADAALRLHLADLLARSGRRDEAVGQCAILLGQNPTDAAARELMARALGADAAPAPQASAAAAPEPPTRSSASFDWGEAEQQFGDGPAPMFTDEPTTAAASPAAPQDVWDIARPEITLADVGGMDAVKERLDLAFLAPMRHPDLRQLYGKSFGGGLLLYGPPGCGKTLLARALAGEMGGKFLNIALSDVLDMWIGRSEQNLHELFEFARRNAPVVVFIDEIDAIGGRRSRQQAGGLRNVVNQLLTELDGVQGSNDGVYLLAATNAPWDVDPALRRPGRFDRTVFVSPPDTSARAAILRHELARRPVEGIQVDKLARDTAEFSGADLVHLCDAASEMAMHDALRTGTVRMITMGDLTSRLREIRPSTRAWLDEARTVVTYSDRAGEFDELRSYLRARKLL